MSSWINKNESKLIRVLESLSLSSKSSSGSLSFIELTHKTRESAQVIHLPKSLYGQKLNSIAAVP